MGYISRKWNALSLSAKWRVIDTLIVFVFLFVAYFYFGVLGMSLCAIVNLWGHIDGLITQNIRYFHATPPLKLSED